MPIIDKLITRAENVYRRSPLLVLFLVSIFMIFVPIIVYFCVYYSSNSLISKNYNTHSSSSSNKSSDLNAASTNPIVGCNVQSIACTKQFIENKKLVCETFKDQVLEGLKSRNDSPCKDLSPSQIASILNEACTKECTEK